MSGLKLSLLFWPTELCFIAVQSLWSTNPPAYASAIRNHSLERGNPSRNNQAEDCGHSYSLNVATERGFMARKFGEQRSLEEHPGNEMHTSFDGNRQAKQARYSADPHQAAWQVFKENHYLLLGQPGETEQQQEEVEPGKKRRTGEGERRSVISHSSLFHDTNRVNFCCFLRP